MLALQVFSTLSLVAVVVYLLVDLAVKHADFMIGCALYPILRLAEIVMGSREMDGNYVVE